MKRGGLHIVDTTGDAAISDVASASLFERVLSKIDDPQDRVILLAYIGLDISVRSLAQTLKISTGHVTDRIDTIVAALREDTELADRLQDFSRAGKIENYHALTFRLGLQSYFCSSCAQFMAPSETSAPRRTCSGRCRTRLSRADGKGWKDDYLAGSSAPALGRPPWSAPPENLVRPLVGPIDRETPMFWGRTTYWWRPDTRLRDRAIVLLGFTGPVELTPNDLAALNLDDVVSVDQGAEIRLRRRGEPTRYLTIERRPNPSLCPVGAVETWKRHLTRARHTSGPLFVRMGKDGNFPVEPSRIHPLTIAATITDIVAGRFRILYPTRVRPSTPLPAYLVAEAAKALKRSQG